MRLYIKKKINLILSMFIFIIIFIGEKKIESSIYSKGLDNINYTKKIPILAFHRIVPDDLKKKFFRRNRYVGSLKIFNEMIKYIFKSGYKTISSEEFYEWYIGKVQYDNKTLLITLDDGHYEDYYLVYPIIKKYNLKATSFVIGSKIKEKTAPYYKYNDSYIGLDSINKVREDYPFFEFQSHSFNMHYNSKIYNGKFEHRIKTMSYEEIKNDTLNNKKYGFITMAYPYGAYNKDIKKILLSQGYLVAFKFGHSAYAIRKNDRFAIPRISINGNAKLGTLKKWLNY